MVQRENLFELSVISLVSAVMTCESKSFVQFYLCSFHSGRMKRLEYSLVPSSFLL